jgi:hypothetical protein
LVNLEPIAPEALRLPLKERALLAASLWESIEDPYPLGPEHSDEAAINLALERDAEIETGMVKPISHGDLMERLRK